MSTFNEFLTAHRLLVIPLDVKRKTWTRFRNHRDLTAMMKVAYELALGYGQRERETDPKTVEEINNLQIDRKSTRLNSSHPSRSRMPSSA